MELISEFLKLQHLVHKVCEEIWIVYPMVDYIIKYSSEELFHVFISDVYVMISWKILPFSLHTVSMAANRLIGAVAGTILALGVIFGGTGWGIE